MPSSVKMKAKTKAKTEVKTKAKTEVKTKAKTEVKTKAKILGVYVGSCEHGHTLIIKLKKIFLRS